MKGLFIGGKSLFAWLVFAAIVLLVYVVLLERPLSLKTSSSFGSYLGVLTSWSNSKKICVQQKEPAVVCRPKGIHLAQASDMTHDGLLNVTVSFMLDYHGCGNVRPTVIYGQGMLPEGTVHGETPLQFHYTSDKSQGLYESDYIYHIPISNLAGGQKKYWYKIRIDHPKSTAYDPSISLRGLLESKQQPQQHQQWYRLSETDALHFWTPPILGQPTAMALIGDLGQTENSTKTISHILKAALSSSSATRVHPVSQLLIAGDMSYADSDPDRWSSWFAKMQPLASHVMVQVAPGNHEIECDTDTLQVFEPYEHYFRVPNRLGEAERDPITPEYKETLWHESCSAPSVFLGTYNYGNSYYAYTHGLARIIVLNSYTRTDPESAQYQFLERELQRVQRDVTPWLLVSFHCPLYTTFLGHVNELQSIRMRVAMEPLFLKYQVNLIISGHDHAYMRTYPMYNGTVVPDGRAPIYVTLGAGGNREQHSAGYRHPEGPESWVAKRDISDYGYGHLFLPNRTHARLVWVRNYAVPDDMAIHESVWLVNPYR